jgi:hypothetical protein
MFNFFSIFSKKNTSISNNNSFEFSKVINDALSDIYIETFVSLNHNRHLSQLPLLIPSFLSSFDYIELSVDNLSKEEFDILTDVYLSYISEKQKFLTDTYIYNENNDRFLVISFDFLDDTYKLLSDCINCNDYKTIRVLDRKYVEQNFSSSF